MGYKVSYSGSSMDTILEKAQSFEVQNEAWAVIPSSIETLDVTKLLHEGNYVYSGILSFPDMDQLYGFNTNAMQAATTKACSCMIFVRFLNDTIYQMIHMNTINDSIDSVMIIAWIRQADYTYIPKVYYNNEPSNTMMAIVNNELTDKGIHKFTNQIRLFRDSKVFAYYDAISQSYIEFLCNNMKSDVYGSVVDIFNYIDTTIPYPDYTGHINDTSIHITSTEKTTFNSMETTDTLDNTINTWKTTFLSDLDEQIATVKAIHTTTQSTVNTASTNLSNHISDTVKHPTAEQRADWDSKSDKEHTHTKEQITISTDDVSGTFDSSQITDEAKEFQVSVNSQAELLALTSNDVHNGCWVLLVSDTYPLYYVVSDDTKLGTMEAFTQLNESEPTKTWENVQNKPTTINELGIEDKMSNSEVDALVTNTETTSTNTENSMTTLESKVSSLTTDQITNSHSIEALLDLIDYKMQLIKKLIATP